ncbi:unnamed protein product [Microthlaspi erraticum]|uniref:Uncharacterized protein n=1 Tax=Microthlaspi erraticum TaxID=1685480 RepID=A0A6D2IQ70_9BRAS|nr:unnamed protein product [Microthlaspi erraticum]
MCKAGKDSVERFKGGSKCLVQENERRGPLPNSGTYNTLIRAHLRDGDKAASAELINEMRAAGRFQTRVDPNTDKIRDYIRSKGNTGPAELTDRAAIARSSESAGLGLNGNVQVLWLVPQGNYRELDTKLLVQALLEPDLHRLNAWEDYTRISDASRELVADTVLQSSRTYSYNSLPPQEKLAAVRNPDSLQKTMAAASLEPAYTVESKLIVSLYHAFVEPANLLMDSWSFSENLREQVYCLRWSKRGYWLFFDKKIAENLKLVCKWLIIEVKGASCSLLSLRVAICSCEYEILQAVDRRED